MIKTDVIIIGAGLLGCFAARSLSRYELNTVVLEKREDVCTGISRANSGIIYAGYDTKHGTLKTDLTLRGNESFDALCSELEVSFNRCGSIMISCGERAERVIKKKYENGVANGVKGLKLISREEILELEPNLTNNVTMGLFAETTGTVNPWELGIAAFENARANGIDFKFNSEVINIEKTDGLFSVCTEHETYLAKTVINCGGLSSDKIRELCEEPKVRIIPSAADYLVLDNTLNGFVNHVIFHESELEGKGKGLTLIPTVDGNILAGPASGKLLPGELNYTGEESLSYIRTLCEEIVPSLDLGKTIRNFGATRPNPYYVKKVDGEYVTEDDSIPNFTILEEDGLFSFIGIKTPGLTCSKELGDYICEKAVSFIGGAPENRNYNPHRSAIKKNYGRIICRCQSIGEGEIIEAIKRGATTVDGVKRRVGTGMGRCQGGYCMEHVMRLLEEHAGINAKSITKDGAGSEILK